MAAAHRLATQSHRLLFGERPDSGIDLWLRSLETGVWFAGKPLYELIDSAVYPPASYLMLWPLLGWGSPVVTKWLWALTSFALLAGMARAFSVAAGAGSRRWRLLVLLIPVSSYATAITIGNGQIGIHVLFGLTAALALVAREGRGFGTDALIAACMVGALVKPSLAAPFFWIVVFAPGGLRPAVLTASIYAGLTLASSWLQGGSVVSHLAQWFAIAARGAEWGASAQGRGFLDSYGSLHHALYALDLTEWNRTVSQCLLLGFGAWVWRHRAADVWTLAGCAAVVARLWTYHRVYDDILIVLAMLALARVATRRDGDAVAGVLLSVSLGAILVPASLLSLPSPFPGLFVTLQLSVWLAVLAFLAHAAARERREALRPVDAGPGTAPA